MRPEKLAASAVRAVTAVATASGLINSWVLLVEIKR